MERYNHAIARMLLQIGAVSLSPQQPFTWTSGLRSPIYTDNRLTMSYPHVRGTIAAAFVQAITQQIGHVDVIAGVATAGIPHAAFVADRMSLPMSFIRGSAKSHGKKTLIEGIIKAGDRVVVIEDTFSTGGSAIKAAQDVDQAGGVVVGVGAIFSYQFENTTRAFIEAGFHSFHLTDYETLIGEAMELGMIMEEDLQLLEAWKRNPQQYQLD